MAPPSVEATGKCHVVAMPYPGRGHINPMMSLCKSLASRISHVLITFVVTEEWLGLISSDIKPANIRFGTIPNVLPSELVRSADMVSFVEATSIKMEEPFERLLDALEQPVTVIVADTFLSWAADVGNRRNIPVASFWPMPVSVLSIFFHFDLLVQSGHFPINLSERGDERADYIPGLSPIRLAELPSIIHKNQKLLDLALSNVSKVTNAQFLLLNSIFELEAPVIKSLRSKFPFPIYSLGPLIPHSSLPHRGSSTADGDCLKWLDSQPHCSVLYVSLGSYLSVSSAQLDEIAAGLRVSGVRFLWAARGEASRLAAEIGGAGVVVPWCDQLKVLCHPSVGGFWTHCGWNSTLESIFAGVPMLAFPLMMDQIPISKFIEDDWKIGWKMKRGVEVENVVGRKEIGEKVKRFMDEENAERKEMVKRARELGEICRGAIKRGGSTELNFDAFVKDISRLVF